MKLWNVGVLNSSFQQYKEISSIVCWQALLIVVLFVDDGFTTGTAANIRGAEDISTCLSAIMSCPHISMNIRLLMFWSQLIFFVLIFVAFLEFGLSSCDSSMFLMVGEGAHLGGTALPVCTYKRLHWFALKRILVGYLQECEFLVNSTAFSSFPIDFQFTPWGRDIRIDSKAKFDSISQGI